tara:strand:+ start:3079 stop:3273 length:195 start_codon:yes stop_codon:yes gene_type:complete
MKKPKSNKVLVTYPDGKSFYKGTVESLLSIQFTANYKDEKGNACFGFYFYNDRNDTWKDLEEQD